MSRPESPEPRHFVLVVAEDAEVSPDVVAADAIKILTAAGDDLRFQEVTSDGGFPPSAGSHMQYGSMTLPSNQSEAQDGDEPGWWRMVTDPSVAFGRPVTIHVVRGEISGTHFAKWSARALAGERIQEASDAAERLLGQLTESMEALAPSLAAKEGAAVSPQVAFALAQEEQDLRAIETEFGWLGSGEVAEQLGKKPSRTLASSMRAKGKLLGYVRRGQQQVRYPRFQFDGSGVLPVIPELIAVADERNVAHEDLIFWLCAPSGMLEGDARPVDLLKTDPEAVLAAARFDLGGRTW